jgi:hypothetical protein
VLWNCLIWIAGPLLVCSWDCFFDPLWMAMSLLNVLESIWDMLLWPSWTVMSLYGCSLFLKGIWDCFYDPLFEKAALALFDVNLCIWPSLDGNLSVNAHCFEKHTWPPLPSWKCLILSLGLRRRFYSIQVLCMNNYIGSNDPLRRFFTWIIS